MKPEAAARRALQAEVLRSRVKSPESGQQGSKWDVASLEMILGLGGRVSCACEAIVADGSEPGMARYTVREIDRRAGATAVAIAALGGIHEWDCDGMLR